MDSGEAEEMLNRGPVGVREWNKWRKLGEPVPQLTGDLKHLDLRGVNLSRTHLSVVSLDYSDLTQADFRGTTFSCSLYGVTLDRADFRDGGQFAPSSIEKASLIGTRGLFGAHRPPQDRALNASAERARFHYKWDLCGWERISKWSSARFFAVSYAALIVIVIAAGTLGWYNKTLVSTEVTIEHGEQIRTVGLPALAPPDAFFRLLLAIMAIAAAATIHKLRCPQIVAEFTSAKWARELERSLVEYQTASYSRIIERQTCAVLYLIGGGYALYYLAERVWGALRLLSEYTA